MSETTAPSSSGGGLFGIDLSGITGTAIDLFTIDFLSDRGIIGSTAPEKTLDQSDSAQSLQSRGEGGLTGTEIALMVGGGVLVLVLVVLILKD